MPRPSNPLWRHALATYRRPGVAAACLALQDQVGADVNLLLYCVWQGRCGRVLAPRALRAAVAAVRRLQSAVIAPLRQARRALRPLELPLAPEALAALRKRIGALELELEFLETALLHATAAQLPPGHRRHDAAVATTENLARYLALLPAPGRSARSLSASLVQACLAPRTAREGRFAGFHA